MVYKAAVQILKKADDLKLKLEQKYDLLNDSNAWNYQQELQTIYHQVLILDLEYALDKKVEQELWTLGFKNFITSLQELTRDKKNPKRADAQALLSWCLEAASGFYLTLLQELCSAFSLDFPFRRKGSVYGQIRECGGAEGGTTPQASSCIYICQYCLVHLGDIARYRNQRKQSESFYRQAILVSPTSGHPYNQLALLEASQSNKLSTVYHYVRSIAVKNPFPAATTNLTNTLLSAVEKEGPITENTSKLTLNEFIQLFLSVHGLLHTATDLQQAKVGVKILNSALTALVATESFTTEKLLEMTAINFYALFHTIGANEELTEDEMCVKELVLELLAGSLSAFLIPVHTLKTDESLLDYYALSSVKFLLNWIQNNPDVLQEKVFSTRLQIWPSLCKLLNNFQPYLKDFNYENYENTSLPEDKEIQGFIPITKHLKNVDFKNETEDKSLINRVRAKRLINFGLWVCETDVNGKKLVIMTENEGKYNFEPACIQPDPTESLLEEMRSVNLVETSQPINKEKRGGILKPQGSLEKNREERELLNNNEVANSNLNKDSTKLKRVRQNVALQSIFKKIEESKQVKFSVETTEKDEKLQQNDVKPPPKQNQPLRTQTFSQNHPGLANNDLLPPPPQQQQQKQNVNVLPPLPTQNNLQYPPPLNQQNSFPPPRNLFTQPPPPFHQFHQPPFSPWKQEEQQHRQMAQQQQQVTAAPPTWWPQNQNFPPPPLPTQQQQQENLNFQQQQQQQFSYLEGFGDYSNKTGYSPWRRQQQPQQQQQRAFLGGGFEGQGQNLSMRQVMLKEAVNIMPNFVPAPNPARTNPGQLDQPTPSSNNFPNAGAYSLFNATSWNPNLPTHMKTPRTTHENFNPMQHHSLFAGQGPQSLMQLLEQQNQWQKNDS